MLVLVTVHLTLTVVLGALLLTVVTVQNAVRLAAGLLATLSGRRAQHAHRPRATDRPARRDTVASAARR